MKLGETFKYCFYIILLLWALFITGCTGSNETESVSKTGIVELYREELQMPSFYLPSPLSGNSNISSDSYKGKVVLVSFFASWCRSCLEEIPLLNKLQKRYSDQGFSVIALAVDSENKIGLKNLIQKRNIEYPVLLADEAVKNDFGGIAILPTLFLINREGKILKKYFGHIERDSLMQDIKQSVKR